MHCLNYLLHTCKAQEWEWLSKLLSNTLVPVCVITGLESADSALSNCGQCIIAFYNLSNAHWQRDIITTSACSFTSTIGKIAC